jgi:hypothetical protein
MECVVVATRVQGEDTIKNGKVVASNPFQDARPATDASAVLRQWGRAYESQTSEVCAKEHFGLALEWCASAPAKTVLTTSCGDLNIDDG